MNFLYQVFFFFLNKISMQVHHLVGNKNDITYCNDDNATMCSRRKVSIIFQNINCLSQEKV